MRPIFTLVVFLCGLAFMTLLIGRMCYEEGMDFD